MAFIHFSWIELFSAWRQQHHTSRSGQKVSAERFKLFAGLKFLFMRAAPAVYLNDVGGVFFLCHDGSGRGYLCARWFLWSINERNCRRRASFSVLPPEAGWVSRTEWNGTDFQHTMGTRICTFSARALNCVCPSFGGGPVGVCAPACGATTTELRERDKLLIKRAIANNRLLIPQWNEWMESARGVWGAADCKWDSKLCCLQLSTPQKISFVPIAFVP